METHSDRRGFLIRGSAALAAAGLSTDAWAMMARQRTSEPRLRVGLMADPHVVTRMRDCEGQNCLGFEPTLRFFDHSRVDAVLCCGDITDFGTPTSLRRVAEIWHRVFPGGRRSDGEPVANLFHYGDHDTGNYANKYDWAKPYCEDPGELSESIPDYGLGKIWEECFHEKWAPIQVKDVKGYRFVLAHHPLHTAESHNGDVIPGLAEFMSRQTFDPTKPFFFSQHRPAARTVCGPWADDKYDPADTKAVLRNYPNCVAFFAHWHRSCADDRNLWQDEFTAVELPSLNYCTTALGRQNSFCGNGRTKDLVPRANPSRSWQALLADVHDDRIVLHRYDMFNQRPIACPWVIPLPLPDGSAAFEKRAARSVPPEFADGASVTTEERTEPNGMKEPVDRVVVSFPVAHGAGRRERAFDYLVTARWTGGREIARSVFSKGLYWADERDVQPVECHFAKAELPADWRRRVSFAVTPRDSYGNGGQSLRWNPQA